MALFDFLWQQRYKFGLSALCSMPPGCAVTMQFYTVKIGPMRHDLLQCNACTSNTQSWLSNTKFAPPKLKSISIDLLAYQWMFQTMKMSNTVMGLIFVSQKPTFWCFSFGTFFILIQLCSFCFLFDFLAEMMKILSIFCRDDGIEFRKRVTRATSEISKN